MKGWVRFRRGRLGESTCCHCGRTIVFVDDVGWLDPHPGGTYDICPADPYGNHQPGG